jgi:hypothetical protein
MDHSTDFTISYLCSTCSSIFSRAEAIEEETHNEERNILLPVGKPSYPHQQKLSDLKQSAEEKCYLCVRLWEQVNPKAIITGQSPHDPNRLVDIRYSLTAKTLDDLSRINVWLMEGELTMTTPFHRRYVVMPTKGKS